MVALAECSVERALYSQACRALAVGQQTSLPPTSEFGCYHFRVQPDYRRSARFAIHLQRDTALESQLGEPLQLLWIAWHVSTPHVAMPSSLRRRGEGERPSNLISHRSCRLMRRKASGNLLALRERQCQLRTTPCRRTSTPCGAINLGTSIPSFAIDRGPFSWYKRRYCGRVKLLILLACLALPANPFLSTWFGHRLGPLARSSESGR